MRVNFAFFLLLIFLGAIITGWEWPGIAKIMPVYVAAIPGLIMVAIQIYREATGWEGRRAAHGIEMDDVSDIKLDPATERRRTLSFFGWFIGGALGIWLIGIVISLPLLIVLYAMIEGKEKWYTSLILGVCTYLLLWGLFEYMLETRWPPGLLLN